MTIDLDTPMEICMLCVGGWQTPHALNHRSVQRNSLDISSWLVSAQLGSLGRIFVNSLTIYKLDLSSFHCRTRNWKRLLKSAKLHTTSSKLHSKTNRTHSNWVPNPDLKFQSECLVILHVVIVNTGILHIIMGCFPRFLIVSMILKA